MIVRIVPCLAGGNASATCLTILIMSPAEVQWPAPVLHVVQFLLYFDAQYKKLIIIIIIVKVCDQRCVAWLLFVAMYYSALEIYRENNIMSIYAYNVHCVDALIHTHNNFY